MRIFRLFWIRFNLFLCCAICFSTWQFMILIKEHACMLLTGRMVFSNYTKKRILFYHAKGSHACSHHTHARSHHVHAQSHTSLSLCVLFCSCSFRLSRSTALQVMASTLDRAQLLDYTRAGVRRTSIKFNCNTRVVCIRKTDRTVHCPFSVRAWSVQYPFEVRSIVV